MCVRNCYTFSGPPCLFAYHYTITMCADTITIEDDTIAVAANTSTPGDST